MSSRMASTATRLVRLRTPFTHFERHFSYGNSIATTDFHSFALRRTTDEDEKKRNYHTTAPSERAAALILGLASVSALGYAGSSAVQSYNEWKAAQPSPEEVEAQEKEQEARNKEQEAEAEPAKAEAKREAQKESKKPRANVFKEWFGVGVGAKYYEGGFEDTMTKREAALILGVRESSSPQRIKDAHRKLLILNHPDRGGSTFMAGKINEAKEFLLKGRARV
jgi:DnaJ family protein C protein 19